MAERNYTSGDRAALIALSGASCYWPGCGEPLLKPVDRHYEIMLEIAHIRGLKEGSARYDERMTDDERNAFANIIFLCRAHHITVDRREPHKYPVDVLLRWKSDRESEGEASLRGLRDLTEDRLLQMIVSAMAERDEQIRDTLARLEQKDAEAARVMRELLDELEQVRRHGSLLDPDVVGMLDRGSGRLVALDPDVVAMLDRGTGKLGALDPDVVAMLRDGADKLSALDPDTVAMLARAAGQLNGLPSMIEALQQAAYELNRHGRNM